MSESNSLAPIEREFIQALSQTESEITLSLTVSPDPDRAWDQLALCLNVHRKAESIAIKLRPIIGKLLLWARDYPEFYERQGYRTYDLFIREYVCGVMGLGRSVLYETRMIADRLPNLTPDQYQSLGPTKAIDLAKICKDTDGSYPAYLAEAQSMTPMEFRKWTIAKGLLDEGDTASVPIVIVASKGVARAWEKFRLLAEVQAQAGGDNQSKILEALMMEATNSWFHPNGYRVKCPQCSEEFSI